MTHVPFVDLHAQYLSIGSEIDAAIKSVIAESAFIRGPYVDKFEHAFAQAVGAQECISCANGTDAIYIALKALNVGPGDEVIVPAMSWISTSETVTQAGGKVVFCDLDPESFTMDPTRLEACLSPRTVGIIPVHLYGQPADMDSIMSIAARHGLWVIEDCAQSHLATYKGRMVGSFGVAATFSFYPGKNLGAMGDAGAIVTGDRALADHMRRFARHGGLTKGEHLIEGINSRLDGLQAAILSVKLGYLAAWTEARRALAQRYSVALEGLSGLMTPRVAADRNPVWHLYVVMSDDRDGLSKHLKTCGIDTVVNYPKALPFLPCYGWVGAQPEDFPVAHDLQSRCLSLPIFPEMSDEQFDHVVASVKGFANRKR